MRQIGIKYLQKNLSKELAELPFEIVKYGKVIATVINQSKEQPEIIPKVEEFKEVIAETKDKVKEYKQQIVKVTPPKKAKKYMGVFGICPKHHGSSYFTCGCKPTDLSE